MAALTLFIRSGMGEDRLDDRLPVGSVDPVARAFQGQQPCGRDFFGERLAVPEREQGIRGSMDHQGGHGDRRQRLSRWPAVREGVVVLYGGEVVRTLDVTTDKIADGRLVEGAPPSASTRE